MAPSLFDAHKEDTWIILTFIIIIIHHIYVKVSGLEERINRTGGAKVLRLSFFIVFCESMEGQTVDIFRYIQCA